MSEYKNPLETIPPLTREEYFALPNEIGGYLKKYLGHITWENGNKRHYITTNAGRWADQDDCPNAEWKAATSYFYGYITKWREEEKLIKEGDPKQLASTDKAPLDLIPPVAEEQIAHVLKLGADKYGVYNWRGNIDSIQDATYYGATRRHINAMMKGEALDPESQRSHWAHIGATAMIMLEVINEREEATQS